MQCRRQEVGRDSGQVVLSCQYSVVGRGGRESSSRRAVKPGRTVLWCGLPVATEGRRTKVSQVFKVPRSVPRSKVPPDICNPKIVFLKTYTLSADDDDSGGL